MSGLKVNNRHAFIEAYHMKPFAQKHDDTLEMALRFAQTCISHLIWA
ncbi:MAG: hypothetical protein ACRDDZ_11605 [Marinifilaceae bacterium]